MGRLGVVGSKDRLDPAGCWSPPAHPMVWLACRSPWCPSPRHLCAHGEVAGGDRAVGGMDDDHVCLLPHTDLQSIKHGGSPKA